MSTPPIIPQAASTPAPIFMPSQTMPFTPNSSTPGQLSGGLQHTAALPSKVSAPRGISRVGAVVARDAGASAAPSKSTLSQPPPSQNAAKMKMNETNLTSTVVIDSPGFQQQTLSRSRGRTGTPEHHALRLDRLPKNDDTSTHNLPQQTTLASSPQLVGGGKPGNADLSQLMDMDSKGGMQGTVAQKDGWGAYQESPGVPSGNTTLVDQPPQLYYPSSKPSTSSLYQTPPTASSFGRITPSTTPSSLGRITPSTTSPSLGNITPPMALRDNIPVSHAAFRALQSRLMAALLAMTPPSTRTALFHVQSANNRSTTALAAAHRAHTLAQQSLAAAQESVAAAQACLASAEQACDRVNSALVVVEHLGGDAEKNNEWEWKELVSEFKSDLRALSDWVGQKEAQETRVRPGKEKESAAQESRKRLEKEIVSNDATAPNCVQEMDTSPETNHSLPRAFEVGTDIARQAWELEREQAAGDPGLPISREDEAQTLGGYHLPTDINVADNQHPASWDANDYGQNLRSEHNSLPPEAAAHVPSDTPCLAQVIRPEPHHLQAEHAELGRPQEAGKTLQSSVKDHSEQSTNVPPSEAAEKARDKPDTAALENQAAVAEKAREASLREAQERRRQEILEQKHRANAEAAARILAARAKEKSTSTLNNLNTPSLPVSQQPKAGGPATPVALGSAVASSTALDSAPNRPRVRVRKRKAQNVAHNTAPATLDARSDTAPLPPNKLSCEGGSVSPHISRDYGAGNHELPHRPQSNLGTNLRFPPLHDVAASKPSSGPASTQRPHSPERRTTTLPTMQVLDIERHQKIIRKQPRIDSPGSLREAANIPLKVKQEIMSDNTPFWYQRIPTDPMSANSSILSSEAHRRASKEHEYFDLAESSSLSSSSNFGVHPPPKSSQHRPPFNNTKKHTPKNGPPHAREPTASYPTMIDEHAPDQRYPAYYDRTPSPSRSSTPNPYSYFTAAQPGPAEALYSVPAGQKRYRDLEDFEQLPPPRRPRLDKPLRSRSPSPARADWYTPRTPEGSPLSNRLAPRSSYGYQRGGDSYRPSYPFEPSHRPFTESEPPSPPPVPATQQLQPPPESRGELLDRFSRPPPTIPHTPVRARRNRNRRGARGGSPNNEYQLEQRIPSKSLMDRIDGDAGVYF